MHFYHFIDMVLFIDCQIAGISGDMILSSLVDIGANKSKIIDGIKESANFLQGSSMNKSPKIPMVASKKLRQVNIR